MLSLPVAELAEKFEIIVTRHYKSVRLPQHKICKLNGDRSEEFYDTAPKRSERCVNYVVVPRPARIDKQGRCAEVPCVNNMLADPIERDRTLTRQRQ